MAAQDAFWLDEEFDRQVFGQYVAPTERDVTRVPHLRAMLHLDVPIPLGQLPPTPESRDDQVQRAAQRAVTVIVRELNDLLDPMLDQLDSDIPSTP